MLCGLTSLFKSKLSSLVIRNPGIEVSTTNAKRSRVKAQTEKCEAVFFAHHAHELAVFLHYIISLTFSDLRNTKHEVNNRPDT